jgi:RimJ/RimL family protein N-acetyltransferase
MSLLIETDRLFMREILPEDEQDMLEMECDNEVHKYIGNKPVTSLDEIRKVIDFIRAQYIDYGIARWAVVKKDNNEFIGWTGFKYMEGPINKQSSYYDFGYRFKSKHWRNGYATESGVAALKYGLEKLKLVDIFAMTHIENIGSRRTLEKLGFRYIETFNYDGYDTYWREPLEPTTWYKYS